MVTRNRAEMRWVAKIIFRSASKPTDPWECPITHDEKVVAGSKEDLVEKLDERLNVKRDTIIHGGKSIGKSERRFGYWSGVRSRETGNQWYEFAEVSIEQHRVYRQPWETVVNC